MASIIQVKNLIKKYNKAENNAVDNISFSVEEGSFFAFLGPNGAGKTTTISILTTTLSKTSGEVKIAGFDLDKDQSKVRLSIGVIFQKPSLDLNLTAEENIRFHTTLYGMYPFQPFYSLMPKAYKQKVNQLSELLEIKEEIFKPIKTFSGGMKRKLEIIRALMHNPKILFLDEPTSGLDPQSRQSLWQYLKHVRQTEKTTIFLTTHYLEEAEESNQVCIINKGKIVSSGTPHQITTKLIDEYLLIDAKDQKKLKQELDSYKFKYDQDKEFKVHLKGTSAQEIIQKIKTPLTLLKTHSPTLEEAYLEVTQNHETT